MVKSVPALVAPLVIKLTRKLNGIFLEREDSKWILKKLRKILVYVT